MRADQSSSNQPRRHHRYDGDRTRSPSPQRRTGTPSQRGNVRIKNLLSNDDSLSEYPPGHPNNFSPNPPRSRGPGRGNWERKAGEKPRPRQKRVPQPHSSVDPNRAGASNATTSTYDVHAYPPYQRSEKVCGPTSHSPNSVQPFLSQQPYSDTQYPYQRSFNANSPEPIMPPSSVLGPASGGNTRTRTRQPQTTEQTRQRRVQETLNHHIKDHRTASRRERRKRGILVDSWIKCTMLPDEFDSDEDSAGRFGGIDEISRSHSPSNRDFHDPGDAGEAAKQISEGLRHISKVLDGVDLPKQRKRLRLDAGLSEVPATSKTTNEPTSAVRTEPPSSTLRSGPTPGTQDDKDPVAKVKRGGRTRGKAKAGDAKNSAAASPSPVTAPKKRRRAAAKKGGEVAEGESSKIGERGIPLESFLKSTAEGPRSEASGAPEEAGEMSGVEESGPVRNAPIPRSSTDRPKSSS